MIVSPDVVWDLIAKTEAVTVVVRGKAGSLDLNP